MAHAIGIVHEAQRSDRDDFITVDNDLVERGQEYNFEKLGWPRYTTVGPYDYRSVMHYGPDDFKRPRTWMNYCNRVHAINIDEGTPFIFCLDTHYGLGATYKTNGRALRENPLQSFDWTSGWTNHRLYKVSDKAFLFLLKKSNGTVRIHKITSAERLGDLVSSSDWAKDWDVVEFFYTNAGTFLFIMKSVNGEVHIHKMNTNGAVGVRVYESKWSNDWNRVRFYRKGDQVYVFLIRTTTGAVQIHSVNQDGTINANSSLFYYNWNDGWNNIEFYYIGQKTFMFICKSSTGHMQIMEINTDGSVGKVIDDQMLRKNIFATAIYYEQEEPFLITSEKIDVYYAPDLFVMVLNKLALYGLGDAIQERSHVIDAGSYNNIIGQRNELSTGDVASAEARR